MKILSIFACLALLCAGTQGATTPTPVAEDLCAKVDHCGDCVDYDVECRECPDGYILETTMERCETCGTGCCECDRDASEDIFCTDCCDGYAINSADECLVCGLGCDTCEATSTTATACTTCDSTYYIAKQTSHEDCEYCGDYCPTCSWNEDGSDTECDECTDYHFIRDATLDCGNCPTYCITCHDDGSGVGLCTQCDTDYSPADDQLSCIPCPSDCATCTGSESINTNSVQGCTSCELYHYKDGDTCENCDSSCRTCSGPLDTDCESCDDNYFLSNGGQCSTCDSNCDVCGSATECLDCDAYYRVDSGNCDGCPTYCEECFMSVDNVEECSECTTGYTEKLLGAYTCERCDDSHCDDCDSDKTECETCATGYVKDSTDKDCEPCVNNCDQCEWNNVDDKVDCSSGQCSTGYVNDDDGGCLACDDQCTSGQCRYEASNTTVYCDGCDNDDVNFQGYVTEWNNIGCAACPSNCQSCTAYPNVVNCTSCYAGFYDDGANGCDPCADSNCATCSNGTHCDSCDSGFVLGQWDQQCLACPDNCGSCTENTDPNIPYTTLCVSNGDCDTGYVINDDDQCESCDDSHCERCTLEFNGDKRCKDGSCESGYTTDPSQNCVACPSDCSGTCTWHHGDGVTWCDVGSCASGYVRATNDVQEGFCVECEDDCSTCTWYEMPGVNKGTTECSACSSGYALTTDGSCIPCTDNCFDCVEPQPASAEYALCDSNGCDPGYGYTPTGECERCPHRCNECTFTENVDGDVEVECDVCDAMYRLNDAVCAACPRYCAECTYIAEGQFTRCLECNSGYALDADRECIACPSNCDECVGDGVGSTDCLPGYCDTGYYLTSDRDCADCSTIFPQCARCTDSFGYSNSENVYCIECVAGYTLQDDNLACIATYAGTCDLFEDRPPVCQENMCDAGFYYDDGHCLSTCYVCGNLTMAATDDECGGEVGSDSTMTTEYCDEPCWIVKITEGETIYGARSCGRPEHAKTVGRHCHQFTNEFDEVECFMDGETEICMNCCEGDRCNFNSGSGVVTFTSALLLLAASFWILH